MEKKIALLLAALLLVTGTAFAAGSFQNRLKYGHLQTYDNMVFDYSIGVYSGFYMLSDEYTAEMMAGYGEGEEADEIYDLRVWISSDYAYQLEVQVKEKTYASFEEEIARAPEYYDIIKDGYAEENQLKQLHEGIVRDLPTGRMLEMATSYVLDGASIISVYYDYYADDCEYIVALLAVNKSYEEAQALLDEVAQTMIISHGEQYV